MSKENKTRPLKVLVITSCTGQKAQTDAAQLTQADFERGEAWVRQREEELAAKCLPAREMYTGLQHKRLMSGLRVVEHADARISIDLRIVSAGYGLIQGDRVIAPYECTFAGRGKADLRDWARRLGLAEQLGALVADPYDLALVLLGDDYLAACDFGEVTRFGGPTVLFCGYSSARTLASREQLITVPVSNPEAKRFSCGLVALKGELGARLLRELARSRSISLPESPGALLDALETQQGIASGRDGEPSETAAKRPKARANPAVDHVIELPASWRNKPHRQRLRYFIPEWDDLVDPDYDFDLDAHSGGTGDWSNEVYAHQMYPEPSYDGILMSRAVAEKSKKKDQRINEMGVHRFLRVPREFPIMGDCGAFDYIDQDDPPYTTSDVIDYYTRLDFDYGVSVDHLVVPKFADQQAHRYELTLHNAEEFIREHRKLGLTWEPIGAVQGWDVTRYVEAARQNVAMGYQYIALGGLVRSPTREVLEVVQAVRSAIPGRVQIHVFGFSRLDSVPSVIRAGANSIDSASMLRKAWLGSNLNYLTVEGWYPAIRVPQTRKSYRAKQLVATGPVTESQLLKLERECLTALRRYSASTIRVSDRLVRHLVEYDALVAGEERKGTEDRIRRTLEAKPWAQCPCSICQRWGVEVIVFRGNNRNRRRGFHNTYIFYQRMQQLANGSLDPARVRADGQMDLPMGDLAFA